MFIKKYFTFFLILIFLIIIFSSSASSNSYFYPVENHEYISSYFGWRTLYGQNNFHTGVDFPVPCYTEVHSFCAGTIIYASFLNGYGNCIIVLHDNGFKSLYAHLSENFIVNVGDFVYGNQVIALVGPTILSSGIRNGNTTGEHLHFELYNEKGDLIDPLTFIQQFD